MILLSELLGYCLLVGLFLALTLRAERKHRRIAKMTGFGLARPELVELIAYVLITAAVLAQALGTLQGMPESEQHGTTGLSSAGGI